MIALVLAVKEFMLSMPVIVSMLVELHKLWSEQVSTMNRRQKMKELKDAIETARKEKNTEGIERVLNSIVNSR